MATKLQTIYFKIDFLALLNNNAIIYKKYMAFFADVFKGRGLFREKIKKYTVINMCDDANIPNIFWIVLEFEQSLVSRFVRMHFSKDPEKFLKQKENSFIFVRL